MKIQVNDYTFYRHTNFMDNTYKEKYIADIDNVILNGHVASDNVPPLQTKTEVSLFQINHQTKFLLPG